MSIVLFSLKVFVTESWIYTTKTVHNKQENVKGECLLPLFDNTDNVLFSESKFVSSKFTAYGSSV